MPTTLIDEYVRCACELNGL